MAGSLNKTMHIGRLGQDPKLQYLNNGTPVATFSIACDESYTDKQGSKVEKTEWVRVVVWSRQAEMVANYLSKGRLVFVEGRLQTREWEDQNGQKRYTTEVVASRVQFLDSQRAAEATESAQGCTEGVRGGQRAAPGGNARPGASSRQSRQDQGDLGPDFPSEASGMDDAPF